MHQFWKPYTLREPVYRIKNIYGRETKLARCEADGGLVTTTQASLGRHLGHKLRDPIILSNTEWIGLKLGLIK